MKRFYKSKLLLFFLALGFCFSSCNTGIDLSALDDPSIVIDESLVLPLGEAHMTVKDFLNKTGLPEAMDTVGKEIIFNWGFSESVGLDRINFADSVYPYKKQFYVQEYSPDKVGVVLPPDVSVNVDVPDYFDLGVNRNISRQRIDSAIIDTSEILSTINMSDDLKLQLDPSELKIQFIFDPANLKIANGEVPSYIPTGYDKPEIMPISKYSMYLRGSSILPYTLRVTLTPKKPIFITDESYVNLYMKFTKLDFSKAWGVFDIYDYDDREIKIPFKIEDYLPDASLRFSDPKIKLSAYTNAGVNLNLNVDHVYAYNEQNPDNKVWAWFNNHTTNSISEYVYGPTQIGDWTKVEFPAYDRDNGEIDHMFDTKPYPDRMNYKYHLSTDMTREHNFITNDSKIVMDMNVEIPLKIRGGGPYEISDTIENFNVGNVFNNVDSAILVLKLRNGLPVKANYRMTFWKSDMANDTISAIGGEITKVLTESVHGNITSDYELKSPKVDVEGNISEIVPQTIKILLNKEQIEALKQTKFIIFHLLLDAEKSLVDGVETPNPVHITTDNGFSIKVGAFVNGSYNTNLGTSK